MNNASNTPASTAGGERTLRLDSIRKLCDLLDECATTVKLNKGDLNSGIGLLERSLEIAARGPKDLRAAVTYAIQAFEGEPEEEEDDDAVCGSCGAPCVECGRALPIIRDNPINILNDARTTAVRILEQSERAALAELQTA
jgi:hypothetical protein